MRGSGGRLARNPFSSLVDALGGDCRGKPPLTGATAAGGGASCAGLALGAGPGARHPGGVGSATRRLWAYFPGWRAGGLPGGGCADAGVPGGRPAHMQRASLIPELGASRDAHLA